MAANKKVLITGSTSGIGQAIAHGFAASGCSVMLHGLLDGKALDSQKKQLSDRYNIPVLASNADLSKQNDINGLMEDVISQWGRVDILVNNAGVQHLSPIENLSSEKWDHVLDVNLHAAFYLSRIFIAGMKQAGWGRIINIASAHGLVASVNEAADVASKHAIVGLTKVIALEAANSGVTCNAICPGFIRTELMEKQILARADAEKAAVDKIVDQMLLEKMPSKEFVRAEDVASLAVYLSGDHARAINGAALAIDGAWTVQ